MSYEDLTAVVSIQAEAYVDEILETLEVITARFIAAPTRAWVAELDGKVRAYLVGYQSEQGVITPWGGEFKHSPIAPVLYLHDLAVSSAARGKGLGCQLVEFVLCEARTARLTSAALVSVQNSKTYWESFGFVEVAVINELQQANLASYSSEAYYMARNL
jgi:predicted GNAT superfamily acetyltransferase